MYVDSNGGVYPGCASRTTYGFQRRRIGFTGAPRLPASPIEKSPIAVYIGSVNSNLFRCPGDKSDNQRKALYGTTSDGSYNYSYTMTSYDLSGTTDLGMTSINDANNTGKFYPFKQQDIQDGVQRS